jgi:hypothetical protein
VLAITGWLPQPTADAIWRTPELLMPRSTAVLDTLITES